MSNALPLQKLLAAATTTSRPAAQQTSILSPLMTTLCGIGICVLLIWLGHGAIKPAKFKLSNSPGRANNLTPLHIIAIFGVWLLMPVGIVSLLALHVKLELPQIAIIAGVIMQLAALFGGLVMATYCFDGGAVRGMGFTARRWINDSIRSVIALLAILPVCMLLLLVTVWVILQVDPELLARHEFLKILTNPEIPTFWRAMVIPTAVLLAPLGEEVIFRGLLQSMFRRYFRRPWVAIVLTSILFSAMHMAVLESLPALFALSLVIGYSYERTGRLYSPIMIHMLFNLVNIAEVLTNTAT